MNKSKKLISIVIPCYGTENYIDRCLNSILNQTYKNLEIILVNDASKGNMQEILNSYEAKDERIKVFTHEENNGLFRTRVDGSKIATGDYIAFVDSDDYVELDYFREQLTTSINQDADIVMSNFVNDNVGNKYIYNWMFADARDLRGGGYNNFIDKYFSQEGKNYSWHVIWNKLIKMEVWQNCLPYFDDVKDHIIMTEDFVFSTILMVNAKKLCFNDKASYFYCVNDSSATSTVLLSKEKLNKNISDIIKCFNLVEEYLKQKKLWNQYKDNFYNWKCLYAKIWYDNIDSSSVDETNKNELYEYLYKFNKDFLNKDWQDKDVFYSLATDYNDKLEKLKEEIISHDVISFDIFDTLITRPLLEPIDLFKFMNKTFNDLFNNSGLIEFSTIRKDSEYLLRQETDKEDITLDEIYEYIFEHYDLDKNKLNKLKKMEIDLELQYCTKRETAYSLYLLALELNKKVIITTDMYLPKNIIEELLRKNGYSIYDKLYLSNELNKSKASGTVYKLLIRDYPLDDYSIIHIGDNYETDVENPNKYGIDSFFFPKTTTVFMNYAKEENNVNDLGRIYEKLEGFNIDHSNFTTFLANRCSLAIVANKYFDNPFITFNRYSNFNGDPYLIGYYALGMHIMALSKWILDSIKENNYDSFVFMARDGYLPLKACKEVINTYDIKTDLKYTYLSRKSLIPLTIKSFNDLYKLKEMFFELTKKEFIDILSYILDLPSNYKEILKNEGFNLNKKFINGEEYYKFINFIYKNFYSKKKYLNYYNGVKKYFEDCYSGKSATFDIGYSAQPELILSNVLGKTVDTYFIHANSDVAFTMADFGHYKLETFYQFKPTFTGILREYLISSLEQSCIGYNLVDDTAEPIFENKNMYSYFDNKMLEIIQNGAIDFVHDFVNIFGQSIHDMEFNHYYMSLPLEYYLHYSWDVDRLIFKGLSFEQNVGETCDVLDEWKRIIDDYSAYDNRLRMTYTYNDFLSERVRNRNIFVKAFFYLFYDRIALRRKIKEKLGPDKFLFRISYNCYSFVKNIKKHITNIFK